MSDSITLRSDMNPIYNISEESDQKLAMVLLVKELLSQVDECAGLLAAGHPARTSRMLLEEMSSVLKQLEPEMFAKYLHVMLTLAPKELPKKQMPSHEYVEAVSKSKKRLISKLRERLVEAA